VRKELRRVADGSSVHRFGEVIISTDVDRDQQTMLANPKHNTQLQLCHNSCIIIKNNLIIG